MANLDKIATTIIYNDKTTFEELFGHLVADGFFWKNGEPPDGMDEMKKVMHEVLQNLLDAAKESDNG
jgi:hypothetical protein